MMPLPHRVISFAAICLLSACARDLHHRVAERFSEDSGRAHVAITEVQQESKREVAFWVDQKEGFFVVSRQPLHEESSEHRLPDNLSMGVMNFRSAYDFDHWREILEKDTGLSIRFADDISDAVRHHKKMFLHYHGPLSTLLDELAQYFGVFWRYSDGQVIFYKMRTAVFDLQMMPGQVMQVASIGQKSHSSGTHAGRAEVIDAQSFYADNQAQLQSTLDIWKALTDQIKALLPPQAVFSVNRSTGTVMVKADPETLSAVRDLVDHANHILTVQVRLKVDVLSLHFDDASSEGFQWHLIYNKINALAQGIALETTGAPEVISSENPMRLSASLQKGPWQGSAMMIDALRSMAKVHVDRSLIVTTLNRQPVPIGMTNQLSYLAETSPGVMAPGQSTVVSSSVGLIPGVVSYGFIMNALPIVLNPRHILLQFVLNISDLEKLSSVQTGQGFSMQKIQTPELSAVEFVHRALLRPGEPLLLFAYEKSQDDAGRSAGIAGIGERAHRLHEVMVIIVTPWFAYHA